MHQAQEHTQACTYPEDVIIDGNVHRTQVLVSENMLQLPEAHVVHNELGMGHPCHEVATRLFPTVPCHERLYIDV